MALARKALQGGCNPVLQLTPKNSGIGHGKLSATTVQPMYACNWADRGTTFRLDFDRTVPIEKC